MKVFISADIEGISTTTVWDETHPTHSSYKLHQEQMTKEVLAACEGAFSGGATEIVVKDAHGTGLNIDPSVMPKNVTLLRNWSGHPYMMVEGVDSTFNAAMFIGYHGPAGNGGNPLSHTISGRHVYIKINGRIASEFMLYSYACALEGVPAVFLSGDKALCDTEKGFNPAITTVAVKDGIGALTKNYSPFEVLENIRNGTKDALKINFHEALIELPQNFDVEIYFKEHTYAEKVSHFPGVKKVTDNIVTFSSNSYYEILRTIMWII